jgi:hypothetical protein
MGRITKLRKSNDYVEMIRWVINVDEVERYMMKKGWTGNKNLDRMGFRKEIYKMVGKEMIWRVKELWDTFLDGVDFEEYEKGEYIDDWDIAIGMMVAHMMGWSWDFEEEEEEEED